MLDKIGLYSNYDRSNTKNFQLDHQKLFVSALNCSKLHPVQGSHGVRENPARVVETRLGRHTSSVQGKLLCLRSQFLAYVRLFVCAKNWVLRCSRSLKELEGPCSG